MTKRGWLCLLLVIVAVFAVVIVLRQIFPPKYVPMEDKFLQELTQALEQQDAEKIKSLFSDNIVSEVPELDAQIDQLCGFYTGTVVGTVDRGSSAHMEKKGSYRREVVNASYDLTTTGGEYRIAFQFCSIDTTDPGEVGIHSMYMIKAEASNMEFAYWGGYKWLPGIVIE